VTPAEVVQKLNATWLHEPSGTIASAVRALFSDDVVVVGPNLQRMTSGGDAVARSYDEFTSSARILDVQLGDPVVDEFVVVAVATMPWSMTYEYEGRRSTERGHEVYVLRREGNDWKICWRQIVSYPS
jgi:ketosteroid isomerase-like protein